MTPYWVLWTFFFLGVLLSQRQEQPAGHAATRQVGLPGMAVAGLVGMILMIGLRFGVGGDWGSYQIMFHRAAVRSFGGIIAQNDQPISS